MLSYALKQYDQKCWGRGGVASVSFKASRTALTQSQPSVEKKHPRDKIVQDRRVQQPLLPPLLIPGCS